MRSVAPWRDPRLDALSRAYLEIEAAREAAIECEESIREALTGAGWLMVYPKLPPHAETWKTEAAKRLQLAHLRAAMFQRVLQVLEDKAEAFEIDGDHYRSAHEAAQERARRLAIEWGGQNHGKTIRAWSSMRERIPNNEHDRVIVVLRKEYARLRAMLAAGTFPGAPLPKREAPPANPESLKDAISKSLGDDEWRSIDQLVSTIQNVSRKLGRKLPDSVRFIRDTLKEAEVPERREGKHVVFRSEEAGVALINRMQQPTTRKPVHDGKRRKSKEDDRRKR